jgi:hypothetical protein
MPCKICHYNQVKDIDRLLLAGATPASVSQRYRSFTTAELQRHAEHLQQKMALAGERFRVNLHLGLFCKLNTVMELTLGVVRAAGNSRDAKLLLQAGQEFTRIVNLMDKMAAKLKFDPEFLYLLTASPQWDVQEEALLPSAFQALADARQTLKVNLFAPCPEPQVPESTSNSNVARLHPDPENRNAPPGSNHLSPGPAAATG